MWQNHSLWMEEGLIKSADSSSSNQTIPEFVGFFFIIGSSLLYGSNYVPVKQFETGDGMFFQFVLCLGIWLVGLVVNCIQNFPKFYPLPMLGGFCWATGNVNSVPIIKTIGLGLGLTIWSFVALVTGWATPRFGLFGLEKDVPSSLALNYVGVALACISVVIYLFVKPETSAVKPEQKEKQPIESVSGEISINQSTETNQQQQGQPEKDNDDKMTGFLNRQSETTKRIIGSSLAIFSGFLYGQYSTPGLYTNQQFNKDGNYLDMIFSCYTGILVSSLGYFVIYALVLKNKPKIYPKSILPGLISGVMWGIATVLVFMATDLLNQATAYPIECSGAPIVSSLWSVLLYREIKGARNLILLLTAFAIAITGSVLIGLSF